MQFPNMAMLTQMTENVCEKYELILTPLWETNRSRVDVSVAHHTHVMIICFLFLRTLSQSIGSSEDENPLLGESAVGPSYRVEVRGGIYSVGGIQVRICFAVIEYEL